MTKVMLIDDSATELAVFEHALLNAGYDVVATTNVYDIADTVAKESPDFVILDLFMPGKSGFDVCADLKKDKRTRAIPIIFLTSSYDYDDVVRSIHVGVLDFIHKPIAVTDFIETIQLHDLAKALSGEWQGTMDKVRKFSEKYGS